MRRQSFGTLNIFDCYRTVVTRSSSVVQANPRIGRSLDRTRYFSVCCALYICGHGSGVLDQVDRIKLGPSSCHPTSRDDTRKQPMEAVRRRKGRALFVMIRKLSCRNESSLFEGEWVSSFSIRLWGREIRKTRSRLRKMEVTYCQDRRSSTTTAGLRILDW